jgi:hypothetical protein
MLSLRSSLLSMPSVRFSLSLSSHSVSLLRRGPRLRGHRGHWGRRGRRRAIRPAEPRLPERRHWASGAVERVRRPTAIDVAPVRCRRPSQRRRPELRPIATAPRRTGFGPGSSREPARRGGPASSSDSAPRALSAHLGGRTSMATNRRE